MINCSYRMEFRISIKSIRQNEFLADPVCKIHACLKKGARPTHDRLTDTDTHVNYLQK